jgi:hypothetical protein
LTAREAEQLLAGQPAAPDRRGLARLLAAAAGPPRPGELTGERAAIEAYRRAYRHPVERRRRRILPALGRTAMVKLSTGAAVVFVGGAALAAQTGQLPEPAQQSAHDLLGVPAPHPRLTTTPGTTTGRSGATPSGPAAPTAPAAPPVPSGSPSPAGTAGAPGPDLVQLCHQYLEAVAKHQDPDPAVRQKLTDAAGGAKKIYAYCTHLVAPSPTPSVGGGGNGDHRPRHTQTQQTDPPVPH